MKDRSERSTDHEGTVSEAMLRRIEVLEKRMLLWRLLAVAGLVTALGAFGLSVFGLGQLQNTYFVGEVFTAVEPLPRGPSAGERLEEVAHHELSADWVAQASALEREVQRGHDRTDPFD